MTGAARALAARSTRERRRRRRLTGRGGDRRSCSHPRRLVTIPKESSRYKSERELKKLLGRMELLAIDVLLTAAEGGNETATRFLLKHWREILSRLKP